MRNKEARRILDFRFWRNSPQIYADSIMQTNADKTRNK